MKKFCIWLASLSIVAACSGTGSGSLPDGEGKAVASTGADVVAVVGDSEITGKMLRRFAAPYPERLRSDKKGLERILESLVNKVLLELEAARRGLDRDPEIVAQIEDYKRHLLVTALVEREAGGRIVVDEREARRWYESHPEMFDLPERVRVRQILVTDEALANQLYDRLKKGERFERLVAEYSVDARSRSRGGDLGVFSRKQRPELAEAAFALEKPGDFSKPFRTPAGWHIIELVRRYPPEKRSFEQVRQSIMARLEAERRQQITRKLVERLRKTTPIKIFPDRLDILSKTKPLSGE